MIRHHCGIFELTRNRGKGSSSHLPLFLLQALRKLLSAPPASNFTFLRFSLLLNQLRPNFLSRKNIKAETEGNIMEVSKIYLCGNLVALFNSRHRSSKQGADRKEFSAALSVLKFLWKQEVFLVLAPPLIIKAGALAVLYFYHEASKKAWMLLQSQPNFSNAKTSCVLQQYSCKDKVL